jgi:hypothetical protein
MIMSCLLREKMMVMISEWRKEAIAIRLQYYKCILSGLGGGGGGQENNTELQFWPSWLKKPKVIHSKHE